MKMLKEEAQTANPKEVISKVSAKVGGVVGARGPGQLPRGEGQVSMAKRKCKADEGDELFIIMQNAKAGERYVRAVKAAPEPAIVVASDKQLQDVVRFCAVTGESEFSILTVDPTFCLGDFECTPTTYRNLLLESKRYKTSPIFLGPILLHYHKNIGTFLFFASTLVSLNRGLQCLRSFGTDGEGALIDSFSHEFRYSIHLYCFIHVRNNIKQQLQTRKYPENLTCQILDEIFGKTIGSTREEGLIDASSNDDFFVKLESIKNIWMERDENNPTVVPGFYQWFFENKVEVFTSGMISSVREDAGLGFPPVQFTTNASESMNAMLKRKVNYKKN